MGRARLLALGRTRPHAGACSLLAMSMTSLARAASSSCAQPSLYDLSADLIGGEAQPLSKYRGKVSLVVNVASE